MKRGDHMLSLFDQDWVALILCQNVDVLSGAADDGGANENISVFCCVFGSIGNSGGGRMLQPT